MSECEKRPNWVEARAKCTMICTFEKIAEAIRHDVSCFNRLPSEERSGRQYDCQERGSYGLAVTNGYNRDEVLVRMEADTVEVVINRVMQFGISQKWDGEKLACDLTIDDELTCPWKVSQKAIGDFLFAR